MEYYYLQVFQLLSLFHPPVASTPSLQPPGTGRAPPSLSRSNYSHGYLHENITQWLGRRLVLFFAPRTSKKVCFREGEGELGIEQKDKFCGDLDYWEVDGEELILLHLLPNWYIVHDCGLLLVTEC